MKKSKISWSLLCLLITACPLLSAAKPALSLPEAAALCQEAEQFFHQANEISRQEPARARELRQRAAARYERVVAESNLHSGPLYYNLGNVYFQIGDPGRAILNYRRAQQLTPNDQKLRQNLQFARAQRQDTFKETEQTKMLKTIFFLHYDFSLMTRQRIFLSLFLASWLLALILLWYKPPWLKICACLIAGLTISLSLSLYITLRELRCKRPGVVLAREVVARKGDGESYAPSFTAPLHAGTEFILLEARPGWSEVRLPDGQTAWLPNQDFALLWPENN